MTKNRGKSPKNNFDDRPLEEVWENMYCNPLDCDDRVYSLKNKEKERYREKNEENDRFFD